LVDDVLRGLARLVLQHRREDVAHQVADVVMRDEVVGVALVLHELVREQVTLAVVGVVQVLERVELQALELEIGQHLVDEEAAERALLVGVGARCVGDHVAARVEHEHGAYAR
jgi:hypothetical protein